LALFCRELKFILIDSRLIFNKMFSSFCESEHSQSEYTHN